MTILNKQTKTPQHVAIIMDGNGRWAEKRGKHRVFGHKHGVKALRKAITFATENKIGALTVFAFSSENWQRPKQEVKMLMELFFSVLGSEVKKLHKHGIKLKIIGELTGFSSRLQKKVLEAEKLTENNQGLILNVAANYGGRWDITQATRTLLERVENGTLKASQVDETMMQDALTLSKIPQVDLMIRTGGEHRISNFLLWQLAYAELYFTDTLWPDFDASDFQFALDVFSGKERRFGQTSEQVRDLD
ncbi:undecaprenyl diphosphate synthase [Psychromonas sp. CNPT3]|uniref:polyprenyl diphosphate synthase n=1 Tax=Psychromonas sp. CNPT3 TaxID=314282 RepID=UPI00006E893D|nr:polyprenyl diphosphate synthase [Psychromonas sp. CNPT3]AGH81983.1 undecaprenyl diphosphate synthase [Psychromonas sp. CNPT3]